MSLKQLQLSYRGKSSLIVLIFLAITISSLNNTYWEGSYTIDWAQQTYSTSPFYSGFRGTEAPRIKNMGDITDDSYPETLIYDGPEKSILLYGPGKELTNITQLEYIDIIKKMLNDSNTDFFDNYGYSTIGVISIKNNIEEPKFEWIKEFTNEEIMYLEFIPDINGDNIQDIILCTGMVSPLPNLESFVETSYKELFINQIALLFDYFSVVNNTNTISIIPKYKDYNLYVLSGKTGQFIKNEKLEPLDLKDCVIDIAVLNNSYEQLNVNLVLLTANVSYQLYATEILQNIYGQQYINLELHGISLMPNMVEVWKKNNTNLDDGDYFYKKEGFTEGNASFTLAKKIDIEASGKNFFLSSKGNLVKTNYGIVWTNEFFSNYAMYNSSNGKSLWKGLENITYIHKNIDLNKNGFGQVGGYYAEGTNLTFILFKPDDGSVISKAILPYDSNNLIRSDNLWETTVIFSDDDKIGDDKFLEFIVLAFDVENSSFDVPFTLSQFARINLNISSNPKMIITPVKTILLNVIDVFFKDYESRRFEFVCADVDFDNDGWLDYIFSTQSYSSVAIINKTTNDYFEDYQIGIISGRGVKMADRRIHLKFSNYLEGYEGFGVLEIHPIKEFVIFYRDIYHLERINMISSSLKSLIYIEDFNLYQPFLPFIHFFNGALYLEILIIGLIILCGIIFAINLKKVREKEPDPTPKLTRTININLLLMIFIVILISNFFTESIQLRIGFTSYSITPEGQLVWFLVLYPMTLGLFALIPFIYSKAAPFFAEKIFINSQKSLYSLFVKRNMKDYQILIIDMEKRKEISTFTQISRMILPLLISLTIGITIYTGLSADGFLYNALSPNYIDHPLTNPNALGVITPDMRSADEIWIEIGRFARYCIQPMIYTYIALVLIIPSSWLLDDAGVCYFEKAKKFRDISDIDSVSKWFLSVISGVFGFTAVSSFIQLFVPMFQNIDDFMQLLDEFTEITPIIGALIVILAIVVFPILVGIVLTYAALHQMEKDYEINVTKLFKRLSKKGIDTTPRSLEVVFETKNPYWFEFKDESLETS
ncbi:MAG: hypothetical protein ACTSRZ_02820 [Promethearchaeota archaeon]